MAQENRTPEQDPAEGSRKTIDRELERLIPGSHNIIYPNDGHQMWYQSPELCRQDAEDFFALHSDAGTETK